MSEREGMERRESDSRLPVWSRGALVFRSG